MYSIAIQHACTFWRDLHNKCSNHLSPCKVITILPTVFLVLYPSVSFDFNLQHTVDQPTCFIYCGRVCGPFVFNDIPNAVLPNSPVQGYVLCADTSWCFTPTPHLSVNLRWEARGEAVKWQPAPLPLRQWTMVPTRAVFLSPLVSSLPLHLTLLIKRLFREAVSL